MRWLGKPMRFARPVPGCRWPVAGRCGVDGVDGVGVNRYLVGVTRSGRLSYRSGKVDQGLM